MPRPVRWSSTAAKLVRRSAFPSTAAYCLAAQTTQDKEIFEEITADLQQRGDLDLMVLADDLRRHPQRQDEAVRIAREIDFVSRRRRL